jgi:transcriptional antiterminator RfaH
MGFDREYVEDSAGSVHAMPESMWYLAYTRPRLEAVALQNLEQQGFNAYLPLYKRLKKTDSALNVVFEPMFPRYVFFRPSRANQSIGPVRSTRGVGHIVSFGHVPAVIMPDTLRVIQQSELERSAVDVTALCNFRPGAAVRFADPAFAGLQGLVKSVSSQRVSVLLEMMGREQIVIVDRYNLELTH